jgi:hypothetical protein
MIHGTPRPCSSLADGRVTANTRSVENSTPFALAPGVLPFWSKADKSNETRAFSIEIRKVHYIFPAMTFSKPGGTHG